jgi:hypothetical protein
MRYQRGLSKLAKKREIEIYYFKLFELRIDNFYRSFQVVYICKLRLGNVDKRCEEENFTISVSQNKNKRMSLDLSSKSY